MLCSLISLLCSALLCSALAPCFSSLFLSTGLYSAFWFLSYWLMLCSDSMLCSALTLCYPPLPSPTLFLPVLPVLPALLCSDLIFPAMALCFFLSYPPITDFGSLWLIAYCLFALSVCCSFIICRNSNFVVFIQFLCWSIIISSRCR